MSDASATNPISTGGGGTLFEQHVGALFLALLLVRAPLPILKDCQIEEVHFQAEHLGWKTDDLLVTGVTTSGVPRRLALQVKRQFTISGSDETCTKAFGDFWADFRSVRFDHARDRLGLVTLRGTNTLLDTFNSLLDCARASMDVLDFNQRLTVDRYLSKSAREYAATIRSILQTTDEAPTDEQFWKFLSVLLVVSFDLNTASAQNEAWIRTLLAMTAKSSDSVTSAEVSWQELLALAGNAMPTATSYRHEHLPENLRNRHTPITTRSGETIRTLSHHSSITLAGIRTTLGGHTEIARDAMINRVLDTLSENQVVLISAPAGHGKSAIAKNCIELLAPASYCLAFRAEEFATSHIDQMLQQAQIPIRGEELLGMLAGQGRKLVFVDSVERLLEASVRDAFADLLTLARKDRSLGLLITCRDYSLATVSAALLGNAGLAFKVIEVPLLANEELAQVREALPRLANALRHEPLKSLLRTPKYLDMAAQMDWSDTKELPTDQRAFRKRFWEEVVRRNASAANGMPERRERVFEAVALRRARELRPFVAVDDLDASALALLRSDGLIASAPESGAMVAPSHDVLEDWAIIRWLDQCWMRHEKSVAPFADDVGGYPAIRRAYRKWLGEMVDQTPAATDFVLSMFQAATLPAHFRDDTLVCALQSASARIFLERHRDTLLRDDGQLLIRVIFLLRVACKASPWWLDDTHVVPSQMLVATGDAWPAVLELVASNMAVLLPKQTPVMLGLIEDFTRAIAWQNPEPQGFKEAAKIGFHLLSHLDDYRMDDMRTRTLQVLAKVPTGDEDACTALIDRAIANEDYDRLASEVAKILLSGIDGGTVCRFLPKEIIRLAKSKFLLRDKDLQADEWPRQATNMESFFGIQRHTISNIFPASSIRGIFLPLLRFHPQQGVDFILELLNHAGAWYGEQRWPGFRLEPAEQIALQIPDGPIVTQWANQRLWGLYRGHEVGPAILQTALMALEAWLLGICDLEDVDVESWLLKILRESNNVMATSVVASVCNAHPEKTQHAALALLSSRQLVRMDCARTVQEQLNPMMSGFFPSHDINELYENERKKSNALPHRQHDLEALAVKLQLVCASREQVFALIDKHRGALPPEAEQSEEHRLWRLALHRMDVRGLRVTVVSPKPTAEEKESQEQQIILEPGNIEPDIQALIDGYHTRAAPREQNASLRVWGQAAWDRRESPGLDIDDWQTFLTHARTRDKEPEPDNPLGGGTGLIAAVCARDHWADLSPEERDWCIDTMVREVERNCNTTDDMARHGRGAFHPDRHAAYTLPRLLSHVSAAHVCRIKEAIAKALTHAVDEVAEYAAEGVGAASTGQANTFAEVCVGALAWGALRVKDRLAEERQRPYEERVRDAEIVQEIAPTVRDEIVAPCRDLQIALQKLSLDNWHEIQTAKLILQIVGYAPNAALAMQFYRHIANRITEGWDRRHRDRSHQNQDCYEFIFDFYTRLARVVLRLPQKQALGVCGPFLDAVSNHPREVREFIREVIVEADRRSERDAFWTVWQAFADTIVAAPWVERLNTRDDFCIGAIFFGVRWKDNVRSWHRLIGQEHRVDTLMKRLQRVKVAFDAYCRFLYDIGETSLPRAYVILADSLRVGDAALMLAGRNTLFCIESLLQRHVYSEPYKLKSDPEIRTAVLTLLDHLVEAGSSAAFRMRDDFVTPLSSVE